METELNIDEHLWFYHKGCTGKHFFIGNPHTFPGRILAWCPQQQKSFFLSVSEVEEMSEYSKYWIKGYLTGNEPSPPTDGNGDVQFSGKEYEEWAEAVDLFATTGYWRDEQRFCSSCEKRMLKSEPEIICEKCRR